MSKLGQMFEAETGKDIRQLRDILEIESAAERALGHKLEFKIFQSDLVAEVGNIFRISSSSREDIDKRIDAHIKNMKRNLDKA